MLAKGHVHLAHLSTCIGLQKYMLRDKFPMKMQPLVQVGIHIGIDTIGILTPKLSA